MVSVLPMAILALLQEGNGPQNIGRSALLEHPGVAPVVRGQDGSAIANCDSGGGVHEGQPPKVTSCLARLACPGGAAVGGVHNGSEPTDCPSIVCVREGYSHQQPPGRG